MCSLKEYLNVLETVAPLYLSEEMIKTGAYDNSGIIVDSDKPVKKVLFALDLSFLSIEKAISINADTILTHHPAIYTPISSLAATCPVTGPVFKAIENGLNVISMHLNLDVASEGIDYFLAKALGAKNVKTVFCVEKELGYGKTFCINETNLKEYVKQLKITLNTDKIIFYGNENQTIKSVASFCGAGGTEAIKAVESSRLDADVIVTSDVKHNQIKELLDYGKKLIILPHYVAEEFGFNKFYQTIKNKTLNIESCYFDDQRFR